MYIKVRVAPGAKKERAVRKDEKTFEISVREPAERNLANARVREILARELGVGLSAVKLVSGHRSPGKMFSVN